MLYEYSLEELIENILSKAYSLNDEMLQEYLIKRYMLLNKIYKVNKIQTNDFSKFICDILYIDVESGKFKYYDSWVSVNSYVDDSISSIVENWNVFTRVHHIFASNVNEKSVISQIESFCDKIINNGKRKSSKIKGVYKKYYYDNYVLSELNASYNIIPTFPIVDGLGPLKEKALSQRTYEDVCEAYISAMFFDSTDNSLLIEKDIENYIYRNHKKYFPDMKFFGKQKELGSGYIADIVLTSDNFDYILEIKNKKDDRLYWQVTNYYNIYNQKTNKKVKIITIAPEYSDEMVESLKKLPYVEVKKFKIKIESGKISELVMEDL